MSETWEPTRREWLLAAGAASLGTALAARAEEKPVGILKEIAPKVIDCHAH